MLATSALLTFPLLPLAFPALSSTGSPLLLPLLLGATLVLSLACSYLQSAVFGLAALWGSKEMLAVMSGQGGIAVLVSGTQLLLAIFDAGRANSPGNSPSSLAAEGLWALAAAGTIICLAALKHLTEHPDYAAVLAPLFQREEVSGKRGVTRKVFRKNIRIEFAVAFIFVVTLVSSFPM
jgi:equilibrative nucleoside transporter 1/2/3